MLDHNLPLGILFLCTNMYYLGGNRQVAHNTAMDVPNNQYLIRICICPVAEALDEREFADYRSKFGGGFLDTPTVCRRLRS